MAPTRTATIFLLVVQSKSRTSKGVSVCCTSLPDPGIKVKTERHLGINRLLRPACWVLDILACLTLGVWASPLLKIKRNLLWRTCSEKEVVFKADEMLVHWLYDFEWNMWKRSTSEWYLSGWHLFLASPLRACGAVKVGQLISSRRSSCQFLPFLSPA